jgi:hypothetical protein
MTVKDKPKLKNVIFGRFDSRRLELTYISERGLVFKCHTQSVGLQDSGTIKQGTIVCNLGGLLTILTLGGPVGVRI